jgi:hypothetical protein
MTSPQAQYLASRVTLSEVEEDLALFGALPVILAREASQARRLEWWVLFVIFRGQAKAQGGVES